MMKMNGQTVNNNLLSGYRLTLLIRCLLFSTFFINMSSFRIASLNVNGARDVKKRNLLYEVLKTKQIAIAFTQETHSSKDIEVEWQREWGGQVVFSRLSSSSGGVAILFSSSFLPIYFDYEEFVRG